MSDGTQNEGTACTDGRTSEIISTTFHKQEFATKLGLQFLQCSKISRYILANGRVWASSCFNSFNSLGRQGAIFNEEFLVLAREDIVRYDGFFQEGRVRCKS